MENKTATPPNNPVENPERYPNQIQLFSVDTDSEGNPVQNAYFIGCHSVKHRDALFEIVQRVMQIMTIKDLK